MNKTLKDFSQLANVAKSHNAKLDVRQHTRDGISILFYRKEKNGPFYFEVSNNSALTAKLLDSVKTKAIQEHKLRYAIDGIFDKIKEIQKGNFTPKPPISNSNPIIELGLLCQRKWGANIVTQVLNVSGPDHEPTIEAQITLPNGMSFSAYGSNQKIAKQQAAQEALDYLLD